MDKAEIVFFLKS